MDVAADEKSLIDSPYNLSLLTLDDIIRLVRKDVGGYWCGGVAYTLYKAYKEAGFRAWVYHYGFHSALTHATTLVEVRDKIYLQDAYFNLEFLNSQKEPLAFFEVLSGLTGRRVAGAVSDEDWRDVHRSDQGKRQADWTAYHQSEDTRCKLRDDQIGQTCQVRTSLEGFAILHPLMSKTREALEELGWPAEIDYLLLYPFALYSDEKGYITDPNQLLEFHQIFTITRRLGGVIPIMSLRSDN